MRYKLFCEGCELKYVIYIIYWLNADGAEQVCYVGYSSQFTVRRKEHLECARNYPRNKHPLYKFLHGLKDSIHIKVLATYSTSTDALAAEDSFICMYRSLGHTLFNLARGGQAGALGYKLTPEQKAKVSAARIAHFKQPGTREKLGAAMKARYQSPSERKKAASVANSPETRKKHGDTLERQLKGRTYKDGQIWVRGIYQAGNSFVARVTLPKGQLVTKTTPCIYTAIEWLHEKQAELGKVLSLIPEYYQAELAARAKARS